MLYKCNAIFDVCVGHVIIQEKNGKVENDCINNVLLYPLREKNNFQRNKFRANEFSLLFSVGNSPQMT